MGWREATLFLVPPLLAIGLSFLVHSQVARWLLRIGGAYFTVTLSLYVFMLIDCRWDKMSAYACNTLPESLEISLSIFNLINVVTYLHVAPFLALWALLVEGVRRWASRRTANNQ